ncbi:hypothetical protein D5125_12955 [Magnetovirga frankeli]|uniref:hypothetical protein n=1 Tax=Magnetovirga frankeli TaxID=947516 RepID=UPI0012931F4A|nr:hypothetical protein D5125_12955 [gamma proteobacterium SS-5]
MDDFDNLTAEGIPTLTWWRFVAMGMGLEDEQAVARRKLLFLSRVARSGALHSVIAEEISDTLATMAVSANPMRDLGLARPTGKPRDLRNTERRIKAIAMVEWLVQQGHPMTGNNPPGALALAAQYTRCMTEGAVRDNYYLADEKQRRSILNTWQLVGKKGLDDEFEKFKQWARAQDST